MEPATIMQILCESLCVVERLHCAIPKAISLTNTSLVYIILLVGTHFLGDLAEVIVVVPPYPISTRCPDILLHNIAPIFMITIHRLTS